MLKRVLIAVFVASVASGLLVGMHYYIAKRLILDPGIAEPWRGAMLAALVGLGLCLVLQPFAERLVRPPVSRIVAWPASLWMGFAFLLLVLLGFSDALLWLAGRAALAAGEGVPGAEPAAAARASLVVIVALVAGAVGLRSGLRPPQLCRVEIALERWPAALDGFRIVQLSDLHIGPILGRAFAEQLVDRANALAPDLVAVTGDLVDGGVRQLDDEVAPLAGLRARHGVYFVTGNHDHYSGARSWCDKARELGMVVLRNRRVPVADRGAVFDLVGVDDHRASHFGQTGGEDLGAALDGRDRARPAVLLAHDPSTFKRASTLGIDLQLSGHTHGGQIWPFAMLVRLAIPFVAGRYRRNGSELYVSRGTGFWGPPMRLLAPAEISEIVLRRRATTDPQRFANSEEPTR
jgi:predicted MPP superfamily phosphohydrolase